MKYLKLYEAFESTALSKAIKYLSNKVDKDSVNRFRSRLLKLQEQLDIPISKISDKDIKYLNRNQALKLRSDKDSENPRGIYCLKFWFSLNEGYIGFTSTGNQVYKFEERKRRGSYGEKYSDEEVDYIKNNLGIKTGNLTPVKNYDTDLKHGSFVIGVFSDDGEDLSRLGLAKIWRDGDYAYAIQNVASGGSSDNDIDGENWTDWRNDESFGPRRFSDSWSLNSVHSPGDDHHKLYIYTPSEEPLTVEGYQKTIKEEGEENPLDYNLPTNSRFQVGNWFNYDWSINSYEDLKRADFAVVLILEDLFKLKTVSSINKERKESKEGASKFLSDDTIRRMNIERYLTALGYHY